MQPIKYGTNSLIKEISAEKLTDALQKPTKVNVNISGANGKSSSSCKQILQQQISAKNKPQTEKSFPAKCYKYLTRCIFKNIHNNS